MSLLSQLFGGGVNMPTFPTDPAAGYDSSPYMAKLKELLESVDFQTNQAIKEQVPGILDTFQRRGIGGSGLETNALSRYLRDLNNQNYATKQSMGMSVEQLRQSDIQALRDWALQSYNAALGQQQAKQQRNNGILGGLINIGATAAGGGFSRPGGFGGDVTTTPMPLNTSVSSGLTAGNYPSGGAGLYGVAPYLGMIPPQRKGVTYSSPAGFGSALRRMY